MVQTPDYSILDVPEFQRIIFYPREDWSLPPPGATDHSVQVGGGIHVDGRFYTTKEPVATLLYFHGNGEVASDYDDIAPRYNRIGLNLFVADYRGYGRSNGSPSFASMASDAHKVLDYLKELTARRQDKGGIFIMGRSLGSHSAIELAATRQDELKGLILESGFAHVSRLIKRLGLAPVRTDGIAALEKAIDSRVRSIRLPVLVIHGAQDELVPPENATHFYDTVGSADKTLLTIPGAGHNDLLARGEREYFAAIRKFTAGHAN